MNAKPAQRTSGKVIVAIIIAAIMIMSGAGLMLSGYGSSSNAQNVDFNGHRYTWDGAYWSTTVAGQKITVKYLPSDLQAITIDPAIVYQINATRMVYVSTPTQGAYVQDMSLAAFELSNFLRDDKIFPVTAVSDSTSYSLPKIDCMNATPPVPVILFSLGNESRAYVEDSCIRIESYSGQDFGRYKDALVLRLAGLV